MQVHGSAALPWPSPGRARGCHHMHPEVRSCSLKRIDMVYLIISQLSRASEECLQHIRVPLRSWPQYMRSAVLRSTHLPNELSNSFIQLRKRVQLWWRCIYLETCRKFMRAKRRGQIQSCIYNTCLKLWKKERAFISVCLCLFATRIRYRCRELFFELK